MTNDQKRAFTPQEGDLDFYEQVSDLLAKARQFAKRQLDSTIVATYYEIGRMIVEREQQGQKRAQYGAKLLKGLSAHLTERYGRGFSVVNLQSFRKFYQTYALSTQQTLSAQSENGKSLMGAFAAGLQKEQTPSAIFSLTWSHYQILMRIDNETARRFYEIETANQQWSVRQLQRQVGSSLYERLALSRDKDKVMALAGEGQTVKSPRDIFKSPYVLEFSGLEERAEYEEFEETHGGDNA